VEGCCEHINVTSGSINFGKFLSIYATGGFSRRAHLVELVRYFIINLLASFPLLRKIYILGIECYMCVS
jgi:hypothetical protein